MIACRKVLVVGGSFRRIADQILVQRRSWEMLRIFSDHMANPVFAMHEAQTDETLVYPLDTKLEVLPLPSENGVSRLMRGLVNVKLTDKIEDLLSTGCVVYLRMPDWSCLRVFHRALSKGNRIISSLHGDWGEGYRRQIAGPVNRVASLVIARYVEHSYKFLAQESEVMFCTGESLKEKYGRLARHSVVIANFLHSTEDVRPPDRRSLVPPYRLLFVGHLEERKGLIYLLRSARLLADEGIETTVTLVGAGPLRESLGQYALKLGISRAVRFVDYIQYGPELLKQYRMADIFILPSISSEGVPKVLMEAMSQGVPVISTDVGSSRQLLGDGWIGLVVPPRDTQQLVQAVKTLIADRALRSALIDRGLEAARSSTRNMQSDIVKQSLQSAVPDILGVPTYLDGTFSEHSRCYDSLIENT